MSISERFQGLTKVPDQPAARLLALANARLGLKLEAPASASVPEVLTELHRKNATVDILRMFAVALPPRERVWWACLAARDLVEGGLAGDAIVEAAETWVKKPTDENLVRVQRAVEAADPDDGTVMAGHAALNAMGRMGPQELANFEAPAGASEVYALVMNANSLTMPGIDPEERAGLLIERALDIARGGQGEPKAKALPAELGAAGGAADAARP